MNRDPRIWRELRSELRRMGASPVRTKGSHETWRLGDGGTFVVVRNHLAASVPIGILLKFRRLRARRGVPQGDDPPLLDLTGRNDPVSRRVGGGWSWAKEAALAERAAVVAERAVEARRAAEAPDPRAAKAKARAGAGRARPGSGRAVVEPTPLARSSCRR
jgi:predicted RNA binding protein YcfA (HicA-like mRNA interferase family)